MFFNKQNDSICRAVLYSVIIAILLFLYKDNPFFKKSKIMVIVDLFFFSKCWEKGGNRKLGTTDLFQTSSWYLNPFLSFSLCQITVRNRECTLSRRICI